MEIADTPWCTALVPNWYPDLLLLINGTTWKGCFIKAVAQANVRKTPPKTPPKSAKVTPIDRRRNSDKILPTGLAGHPHRYRAEATIKNKNDNNHVKIFEKPIPKAKYYRGKSYGKFENSDADYEMETPIGY